MKKVFAVVLSVALMFGLVPGAVQVAQAAQGNVEIVLNGRALAQNADIGYAVLLDSGRTFVPLRLVAEALNFSVQWEADGPNIITMTGKDKTVYHKLGTLEAYDGNPLLLDMPENLIAGGYPSVIATTDVPSYLDSTTNRVMVGLRLISEAFNCEISWAGNGKGGGTVTLTTPGFDANSDTVWLDATHSTEIDFQGQISMI